MIGLRSYLTIAAVLAYPALYGLGLWQGHGRGVDAAEARADAARAALQVEVNGLGEKNAQLAGALLALQRERDALGQALENEARDAVGADRPGIADTGGLQRLQRRWGSP